MAAPKGTRPPAAGIGRKPGVLNKSTASVKNALIEAFEKRGGIPSLVDWAEQDPTEFYKLWAKLLPQELTATIAVDPGLADLIAKSWERAKRDRQA